MSNFISASKAKELAREGPQPDTTSAEAKARAKQVQQNQDEQSFSILPHPAKSNDPADLDPQQPKQFGNLGIQAYHARDPYVPSPQIVNSLEQPLSREELQQRQEELNKEE